jgi:hypothetical protein
VYRPIGFAELRSVFQSQLRAFPRRLLGQTALVLTPSEHTARRMARSWASPSTSLAAFVLRCAIADEYGSAFATRTLEDAQTDDGFTLRVPTDQLAAFNGKLERPIAIVAAFHGGRFRAYPFDDRSLDGATAEDQFVELLVKMNRNEADALREMATHPLAMFAGFYFWEKHDFAARGLDEAARDAALSRLRALWQQSEHGRIPLGVAG